MKRKQILIPKWLDSFLAEVSTLERMTYSDFLRVLICSDVITTVGYFDKTYQVNPSLQKLKKR